MYDETQLHVTPHTYAPLALQEQQLARRERVGEAAAPVWWLSADGTVSSLEQQLQQVVILFEGRQLPHQKVRNTLNAMSG